MTTEIKVAFIWVILTAITFGIWQESIEAGIFLFLFLPSLIAAHKAMT